MRFSGLQIIVSVQLFLLAVQSTFVISAEHKLAIGVTPGLIEKSEHINNIYTEFLDKIDDNEKLFMPHARADMSFQKGQVDCIFPASLTTMPNKQQLVQSQPLNIVSAFVFTRHAPMSLSQLKGKNVALRRGLTYGNVRDKVEANFVDLNNVESGLLLLQKERVDAVIEYMQDLKAARNQLQLRKLPSYLEDQPVYEAQDAVVCYNRPENLNFMNELNQIISSLTASTVKTTTH